MQLLIQEKSMNGTATALREVSDIHISAKPDAGVLDAKGDVFIPTQRTGLMARIDAKGSEEVTIRRSSMWFVGTLLAVIPVAIVIAAIMINWAREDQTKTIQIQQLQSDLTSMKDDLKELKRIAQERQIQDAKVAGYQLGQTDAGATGHKK
jgi:hypothetical protein